MQNPPKPLHKYTKLSDYINALPTVMDRDETNNAITELLNRAASEKDDPVEMAEALVEMVLHLSDSYSSLETPLEMRLLAWIKSHWRTEPLDIVGMMCTMLAGIQSAEAEAFLEEKLKEEKGSPAGEILQSIITSRSESLERRRKRD